MTNLENDFPIIPHESTGVDCCGCIVVKVRGTDAELQCNRMRGGRWRRSGWDSEGSSVADTERPIRPLEGYDEIVPAEGPRFPLVPHGTAGVNCGGSIVSVGGARSSILHLCRVSGWSAVGAVWGS